MQIAVLKSFAVYFGKDTYYFCNDYHEFIDTVDAVKRLKRLRRKRRITQKMFADELGITNVMYKAYEQGKSRISYPAYLRLRKLYGPFEKEMD